MEINPIKPLLQTLLGYLVSQEINELLVVVQPINSKPESLAIYHAPKFDISPSESPRVIAVPYARLDDSWQYTGTYIYTVDDETYSIGIIFQDNIDILTSNISRLTPRLLSDEEWTNRVILNRYADDVAKTDGGKVENFAVVATAPNEDFGHDDIVVEGLLVFVPGVPKANATVIAAGALYEQTRGGAVHLDKKVVMFGHQPDAINCIGCAVLNLPELTAMTSECYSHTLVILLLVASLQSNGRFFYSDVPLPGAAVEKTAVFPPDGIIVFLPTVQTAGALYGTTWASYQYFSSYGALASGLSKLVAPPTE